METKTKKEFELKNEAYDFEEFIKQYLIEKSYKSIPRDDETIEKFSSIEDINAYVQRPVVKDEVDAREASENENLSDIVSNTDNIPDIDEIFDLIEGINKNNDHENDVDDSNDAENVMSDDEREKTDQQVVLLKTEQDQVDVNVFEEYIPDDVFYLDELYVFRGFDNVNDCKELQNEQILEDNQSPAASNEDGQDLVENKEHDIDKAIEIEISEDNTVTVTQVDNPNDKDSIVSSDDDSEYCEGYNSSDFEFISENEAKTCGLRIKNETHVQVFNDNSESEDEIPLNLLSSRKDSKSFQSTDKSITQILSNDSGDFKHTNDVKPSTSSTSNTNTDVYKTRSYYNNLRVEYLAKQRVSDRENHVIPEGDDYYRLFENILPVNMCFADKAVRPALPMNMCYKGIGFDMNLVPHDSEEDTEYIDEADATARKILEKFPAENRKARHFK